jgi:hypothetical protein
MSEMDYVNGLKSLSGNRLITPAASDLLYDASEEMERLRRYLVGIATMDVYTRDGEKSAAEVMRDAAREALSFTPADRTGEA